MPKRKLLLEMSKRHYRRLKYNARNMVVAETTDEVLTNNLSRECTNTDNLQSSSDVIAYDITDITKHHDLDHATDII